MKFYEKAQDPISFLTHFIGAFLAIIGTLFIVIQQINTYASTLTIISVLIFGLSMFTLYSASSIYHYVSDLSPYKTHLRKFDHASIYVLIAGTYTPICLAYMDNGLQFCIGIWAVAILGIIIKLCWLNAPRFLSTIFYLALGWSIVLDLSVFNEMSKVCFSYIAIGGISYSIGAIIYMIKKPNFSKQFGFHELFHIFVMLGTFFHFLAIAFYI